MSKDYYEILGVPKGAPDDEIKKAYRKKAHELHPDKAGGDEAKFKEINEAYQVLSNKEKRAKYDQFGSNFEQMGGGFGGQGVNFDFSQMGGFGDLFGEMFGGGGGGGGRGRARRGGDIQIDAVIDFKDMVFGATHKVSLYRTVKCDHCRATGVEPGAKLHQCGACHGAGQVRKVQQTMFGVFQTMAACDQCQGIGQVPEKKCAKCSGAGVARGNREFDMKIPPGISDGEVLRVGGEGEAARGGESGDLYVTVRVRPDRQFGRQDHNVLTTVELPFQEAALGVTKSVPTVDGPVDLKIPAGTQPGAVLRLKGRGIPPLRGGARGDQLVTVKVAIPTHLTREQKKKLQEW
jgi:molecular chaperone DnaJ